MDTMQWLNNFLFLIVMTSQVTITAVHLVYTKRELLFLRLSYCGSSHSILHVVGRISRMAMQKVIDDAASDNDVCSWLIKYVKAKHNLPNYDKAVRFTKSLNYIDHNADVTETGRLLFEFSQFN